MAKALKDKKVQEKKKLGRPMWFSIGGEKDFSYSKLSKLCDSVDLDDKNSSQNEHSISDGMGGRIELEFDKNKK